MLSTECLITVRKGTSKINTPIVLYRGDKNMKLDFQLIIILLWLILLLDMGN